MDKGEDKGQKSKMANILTFVYVDLRKKKMDDSVADKD